MFHEVGLQNMLLGLKKSWQKCIAVGGDFVGKDVIN